MLKLLMVPQDEGIMNIRRTIVLKLFVGTISETARIRSSDASEDCI
jgi:hypothetical protein